MSMSLMAKAMNIKVGNPLRKLVLLKLADNANDKGEAWPSIPHIAQQCEMAERTVQGHVQSLQKSGFLWIEKRKGSNGINQSNIYHLTLEKGEEESRKCGEFPAPRDGASAAPYGESPAPHGANAAPRDGAFAAPRTSHSFEPVMEPKTPLPPTGGISPEPTGKNPTPKPKPEQPSTQDYQAALAIYNDTVADRLPHAVELNDKRRKGIKRLIGQLARKDLQGFRAYVEAFVTHAPPFFFGDNDRGWTANLDYLLRADTLTKVREGTL